MPDTAVTSTLHTALLRKGCHTKRGKDIYLQQVLIPLTTSHGVNFTALARSGERQGLASPSHHQVSVGMQCERRILPLGWAGILSSQTRLAGWLPTAPHIVCALPTAAAVPADKSSHNLSEAEFAATRCFLRKKPQRAHFKVASW